MGGKKAEHCGRCSMTSVVDVANTGSGDDTGDRDPFGGDRIEVDDAQLRSVSPAVWLGGVKRRLDEWATRLTYGR